MSCLLFSRSGGVGYFRCLCRHVQLFLQHRVLKMKTLSLRLNLIILFFYKNYVQWALSNMRTYVGLMNIGETVFYFKISNGLLAVESTCPQKEIK